MRRLLNTRVIFAAYRRGRDGSMAVAVAVAVAV